MIRLVAWLLIAGLSSSAAAQVSDAQVAKFLDSNNSWNDPIYGERTILYRALVDASARSRAARAADTLAARWQIPREVAVNLIAATLIADQYEYDSDGDAQMKRAADLFRRATAIAPQSAEVWGLAVRFWADQGRCGDLKLRDDYLSKPFAASHYFTLGECESWQPAFVRRFPHDLTGRFELAEYLEDRDPAAAVAMARWALDAVPQGGDGPGELQLAVTRNYWNMLGRSGLTSLLLQVGESVDAAGRDVLLHRAAAADIELGARVLMGVKQAEQLREGARNQWLAALIAANRLADARAEIAHARKGDIPDYFVDVLAATFKGDIYERYVGDGEAGLLWKVQYVGETGMRVVARFLAANQMQTAADLLSDNACNRYHDGDGWVETRRQLDELPEVFQLQWKRHAEALARSRQAAGCATVNARDVQATSSRLTRYPEIALTESEKSLATRPGYQGRIPLPASFELIRAERDASEIRAVCISPAVDPGGEVSPGGYWLLRSKDGGVNWLRPVYLGFQYQAPYVISPEARISMFAPGVLRLEAEVAELDPESITFPSVALSLRREAGSLYIDIPLAAVERDGDGDELTDLLEAKLATDPANADTDGDGLSDHFDDFPQVSARAEPHELAPIIVDMLKKLTGYERAGIIEPVRRQGEERKFLTGLKRADAGSMLFQFIEGDARQFAGLRVNGQVIVLNAGQISELRARGGPFYPLSFPAILVDPRRTRAMVRWSAGWTGGTINYRLKNGRWVGKPGASWITRAPSAAPNNSPG